MFSRYRVSGLGFRCSGFFWVQGFAAWFRVRGCRFRVRVFAVRGFPGSRFQCSGFGVAGVGLVVSRFGGSVFRVQVLAVLGFEVWCCGFTVRGSGFRGSGFSRFAVS